MKPRRYGPAGQEKPGLADAGYGVPIAAFGARSMWLALCIEKLGRRERSLEA